VLRVGVAGLGIVAQAVHLPLLARRWDLFEITALCDLSASRCAAIGSRYDVASSRHYSSIDDMCERAPIDAVLVLTSGSHGSAVVSCLGAGHAVLCEKPFAYSVAEADAVIARAGDAPRVQVAYMKQYDAAFGRLRELLPDASTIRSIEVEVLHPSTEAQLRFANLLPASSDVDPVALEAVLAADRQSLDTALGAAGQDVRDLYSEVVVGSLVHDISLVRDLVGSPAEIDLVRTWPAGGAPSPAAGLAGSVEVVGSVGSGAGLSMRWHYLPEYPAYRETLTVHHDRGSLQVAFPSPYLLNAPSELLVVDGADGSERRSVLRPAGEEFENELVAFHTMVTSGVAPLSGPVEGREDIVTAQHIIRTYCESNGFPLGGEAATA
jgi:myo-inositol 2-dehydrogenase / D-chiro-inositol 1-dehydrogenase